MTTKREIINQAFDEIGAASYELNLSPEEIAAALRRLNQMMAEWDTQGIRIGYDLGGDVSTESGIPESSVYAVAANLGIRIAPIIGKNLSPSTVSEARKAYRALVSYVYTPMQYQYPNTLPLGRGNRRLTISRQYFTETDPLVAGPDSELNFE